MGNRDDPHATLARLKFWGIRSSRIALAVALALLLGACGRFSSSDSTDTSATTAPGEIGAGLTVPAAPTTVAGTKATTTLAKAKCPNTDPTSEIRYDRGIAIELTVSTLCPAHASDIGFTMKVTNTSSEGVHYDVNQAQFFTIRAPRGEQKRRWEDTDCARPTGDRNKPAATLAPGATITITGMYPAPPSVTNREACRRLETGNYDAGGVFLVCDDAAYTDGYCDIAKDTQFFAQPVRITLGA